MAEYKAVGIDPIDSDQKFLSEIISQICDYAVDNDINPTETIATIGNSLIAMSVIANFNAWKRRAVIPTTSKEEALEPEYEGDGYDDNGEIIYDTAYCPICRNQYEVDYDNHDNYCRNCGQKLDWSRMEAEQEGV